MLASNSTSEYEDVIWRMNMFRQSTGINVFAVDHENQNIISIHSEPSLINKLIAFDMDDICSYTKQYGEDINSRPCVFYSFLSKSGFEYQIVPAFSNSGYFIVAGPYLHDRKTDAELDAIIKNRSLSIADKSELRLHCNNLPVADINKSICIGKLLHTIFSSNSKEATQMFCQDFSSSENPGYSMSHVFDENDTYIFDVLKELEKEALKGDMQKVDELINKLFTFTPTTLAPNDKLRSVKNNFIAICGVSYEKAVHLGVNPVIARDLCNNFIVTVEKVKDTSSINRLFVVMLKKFIKLFNLNTNLVYSSTVNRVVQYLCANYSDKISLTQLSSYAAISPNYLCSVFKRETGLSISQYIKKI